MEMMMMKMIQVPLVLVVLLLLEARIQQRLFQEIKMRKMIKEIVIIRMMDVD
jgi:hypothetical protein